MAHINDFDGFMLAIISGNEIEFRQYYSEDYLNNKNLHGDTPIIVACENKNIKIVEFLLNQNCDIEACNYYGDTPIIISCRNGNVQFVELLIKHNCNIETTNNWGDTPVIVACRNGNVNIVELLIKHKCNIEICNQRYDSPIIEACRNGHLNVVELLIKYLCNIENYQNKIKIPIIEACRSGKLEIVEFLIRNNYDIEARNENGDKALIVASQNGHLKIVELLIKNNCNTEIQNNNGETALIVASKHGHKDIVELLIKHNCNIQATNDWGNTSMIVACQNGHSEIVQLLIQHNCSLDTCNDNGETPIILASVNGHVEIVELIIKHNCNIEIDNNSNLSSLKIAKEKSSDLINDVIDNAIKQREERAKINDERIFSVKQINCDEECSHQFCIETLCDKEFRRLNNIGFGAFGTVFKLKDFKTDLILAVKCIEILDSDNQSKNVEQNINEYRNLLDHRYILQYYGASTKYEQMFIFMEYVDQGSLADQIIKSGCLSHQIIIRFSRQILEALRFIHSKSIVHRDLKPQNVLISKRNCIKLSDFGLSCILQTIATKAISVTYQNPNSKGKTFCGTVNYMAPEIINGEKYSYPVDIWAFGATFLEMLTGKHPYTGMDFAAVIFKIGSTKKLDLQYQRSISNTMQSFINQALHPSPQKRSTAENLLIYLNENDLTRSKSIIEKLKNRF